MLINDYIKTRPHLYDFLKRCMRLIPSRQDITFKIFRKISSYYGGNIVFLQIGANDGLRSDPIREFIVRDKWKGLMIEPIPTSYELLLGNYNYLSNQELHFLNAAVSQCDEKSISFYTYDEDKMMDYSLEEKMDFLRKASFDRSHLVHFANSKNVNPDDLITEVNIPTVNINHLVDDYPFLKNLNLLVIDAEGHEWIILNSIDFCMLKPDIIFYESHNLSEETNPKNILEKNNYSLAKIGGDTIAVNRNIDMEIS